jgi:hypothetical protein
MMSSTPGSNSAPPRPRGPARNVTPSWVAATARTAGPVIRTSPVLSSLATTARFIGSP